MKLHYDLQVLAFKSDITRVSTVLYARDLTGRAYPASDVPSLSFHGGSHHAENPDRIAQYSKLNQYHVKCLAYYLDKLKNTPDGEWQFALIIRSCFTARTWATRISISTTTSRIYWLAERSGQLKGGRHLAFPSKGELHRAIFCSVFLGMYPAIHQDSIGDDARGTLKQVSHEKRLHTSNHNLRGRADILRGGLGRSSSAKPGSGRRHEGRLGDGEDLARAESGRERTTGGWSYGDPVGRLHRTISRSRTS